MEAVKCKVQLSSDYYARGGEVIFIVISNVGDSSIQVSKCVIEGGGGASVEKQVNQLLRPGGRAPL